MGKIESNSDGFDPRPGVIFFMSSAYLCTRIENKRTISRMETRSSKDTYSRTIWVCAAMICCPCQIEGCSSSANASASQRIAFLKVVK